jgi:hypothetical protein
MIDIKYAKYLFKKTKYVNLVVLVFLCCSLPSAGSLLHSEQCQVQH